MNMQKLTKKTIEAIQAAQDTAIEYQNTNVDQPHLLYALMTQENGLIPQLMKSWARTQPLLQAALSVLWQIYPR